MESFHLSAEDIMTVVKKVDAFFAESGADRKNALQIRLTAEEILLSFQQKLGEDAPLELYLQRRMGTPRAVIRIPGASFDPFGHLPEDDRLMHRLMENIGSAPVWNYRRSCNEIVFTIDKKNKLSSLAKILIANCLGIGFGLLARLLPETVVHDLCVKWVDPIQNVIMGFLSCLSALLLLFSLTSGICSMDDITTFNRIGRRLLSSLLLSLLIPVIAAAIIFPFFFPLTAGSGVQTDLSVLWQMIINIIPTNLIETFSTGNTMQIVFLAVFSSAVLLVMGSRVQHLVDLIAQLFALLQKLVQKVLAFMPLAVFVSLFSLVANGDISQLLRAYKYPLFFLLLCTLLLASKVLLTSHRHHISPRLFVKKLLPTFLIATLTSSSSAALPENLNTCENRLGIDRQVINVGIAIGQTIYVPSAVFILLSGCLCAAQIFDVPITLSTYIPFIFTVYVMAIATPPIPSGSLVTFTLLLTQLGIPASSAAFIIALDPLIDRISTGTDIACLQMELVDISASLDLLDKEKLHAKE